MFSERFGGWVGDAMVERREEIWTGIDRPLDTRFIGFWGSDIAVQA